MELPRKVVLHGVTGFFSDCGLIQNNGIVPGTVMIYCAQPSLMQSDQKYLRLVT